MVLVLLVITAVASASVGGIYILTKEPIAVATENAKNAALAQVLPTFDLTEMTTLSLDDLELEVYTATSAGEVVGYAVNTATMKGFSGLFRLMVGLDTNGTVVNVNVLSHNETPGLGSKMAEQGNSLLASIKDKSINAINWAVSKSGGDIEALTAATISSVAYADAMERAQRAYNQISASATEEVTEATECCQKGECDNE